MDTVSPARRSPDPYCRNNIQEALEPAVSVDQDALTDTVIFIGREIAPSSHRLRNAGRGGSPQQANLRPGTGLGRGRVPLGRWGQALRRPPAPTSQSPT